MHFGAGFFARFRVAFAVFARYNRDIAILVDF
jgi:hypothetical protein